MRIVVAVAAIALVGASIWYLVAPPRGEAAYHDRAADAAETVRSQVQTARLWVDAVRDDATTARAATVGLEDAERRVQRAAAKVLAYQPPAGADDVRAELEELLAAAESELARLRIDARRGDWDAVKRSDERLRQLAARLDEFARAAR